MSMPLEAPQDARREFKFTRSDFKAIAEIVRERTGIVLSEKKQEMVYSRLSRRIRALGLSSFSEYRALISSKAGRSELLEALNNITTNLTRFFREPHHFDHLNRHVLQPYVRGLERGQRRPLRIWSAGCSSGEEPFSIAMTVASAIPLRDRGDARILATDIDTNTLAKGKAAIYPKAGLQQSAKPVRSDFYEFVSGEPGKVRMDESLRRLISFRVLNLIEDWPLNKQYDAIFCRNTLIYFDTDTKEYLVERFTEQLAPGGFLYLGHSETLRFLGNSLGLAGTTTYRRLP